MKPDPLRRVDVEFEDLQTDADRARYDALIDLLTDIAERVMVKKTKGNVAETQRQQITKCRHSR